jgi:peptidoglycan hydrolase CwlO-like protein
MTMPDEKAQAELEHQLAAAHARIREMIQEIDQRDELIADLQCRIEELEQAIRSHP